MTHLALFLLLVLTIGGCSSKTPPINEYTLFSSEVLSPKSSQKSPKILSVASSKPLSSLMGKSLIYLRENGESGSYLYSRWSDTPAILIQRALIQSLQNNGLFASVIPSSSLAQGDWLLESDLDGFYHRFLDKKSEGYIDITYRIVENRTKRVIASKRFVITSPAPSMDGFGGVIALKNATHELNEKSIAWLHSSLKEIK